MATFLTAHFLNSRGGAYLRPHYDHKSTERAELIFRYDLRHTCAVWPPQPYDNDFLFSLRGNGWHVDRARFDALLCQLARPARKSWPAHDCAAWSTRNRLSICACRIPRQEVGLQGLQVPAFVGSVTRTIPHPTGKDGKAIAPAGAVASFYAVQQPAR